MNNLIITNVKSPNNALGLPLSTAIDIAIALNNGRTSDQKARSITYGVGRLSSDVAVVFRINKAKEQQFLTVEDI